MDKLITINVPVDAEMKAQIKALADKNDQSEAAVMRQAAREFLAKQATVNKKQLQKV